MFNLRKFVLATMRKMVGNMPDYKVMEFALKYYDREILSDEDLAELQALLVPVVDETAPEDLTE